MIRVGIIGCGKIAQVRHLPEYANNKNVQIAGIFDRNKERAKEIAKQYGAKAYESLESLLKDQEIDAVSVCVTNNEHAVTTMKALGVGKHVLCEKPMAMSMEDCNKMVQTAKDNNRILMIAQNQRLTPAHMKAKEMIANHELGEVISFKTTFGHSGPETWSIDAKNGSWFFDKEKAVMGAMADLGIHKIDLIQYLLGQKIIEATAKVITLDKRYANGELIGVDDNAICIYKMEKGTIGTMTASWTYYGQEDNSTIIYGTKGIMKIYADPNHSIVLIDKDGKETYFDTDQIQTNDNQTDSGVIDLFIEGLTGQKEGVISGESVLSAMQAVFASLISSETGKTIKICELENMNEMEK